MVLLRGPAKTQPRFPRALQPGRKTLAPPPPMRTAPCHSGDSLAGFSETKSRDHKETQLLKRPGPEPGRKRSRLPEAPDRGAAEPHRRALQGDQGGPAGITPSLGLLPSPCSSAPRGHTLSPWPQGLPPRGPQEVWWFVSLTPPWVCLRPSAYLHRGHAEGGPGWNSELPLLVAPDQEF